MKNIKLFFIFSPISVALGLLVFWLTAFSSATAAPDLPIDKTTSWNQPTNDRWRILADMQIGRGDSGVVSLNNKIYAVSGFFSQYYGYTDSQEVYDPQTNQWQTLWGFPNPRSDMVVVNANNTIFAIGGWNVDAGGVQAYNHKFDPALGTWSTMASINTPVSGAGGIVRGDSIYVIGGYDGITDTTHVQIYNTTNNTWSTGIPLSTPRSELGAVVLNGLIYAIGGTHNISNSVEIFDPAKNVWSYGPPLPEVRYSMAVVERKGKIYVIGGSDQWSGGNIKDTTFVLDPASGWSTINPLPTARRALDATVISDTIYVIGGSGQSGAGFANEGYGDFIILPTITHIVSDNPDPSRMAQPITVNYQVSSSFDVPTGVVTVTVGLNDVKCSTQLINGTGTCSFTLNLPGTYNITADYGGDSFHYASSDSTMHTVLNQLWLFVPMIRK